MNKYLDNKNENSDPVRIPSITTGTANKKPFSWLLKTYENVKPRTIWLNVTGNVKIKQEIYKMLIAPIERYGWSLTQVMNLLKIFSTSWMSKIHITIIITKIKIQRIYGNKSQ